jgi:hypothetical protein
LRVPLVVAVTVERLKVAKIIRSSESSRYEVIYFQQVFVPEVQSTPSALPLLLFQQLPQRAMEHGVLS